MNWRHHLAYTGILIRTLLCLPLASWSKKERLCSLYFLLQSYSDQLLISSVSMLKLKQSITDLNHSLDNSFVTRNWNKTHTLSFAKNRIFFKVALLQLSNIFYNLLKIFTLTIGIIIISPLSSSPVYSS